MQALEVLRRRPRPLSKINKNKMRTNIDMMLSPLTEKVKREQGRSLNPYAIFPAATVALAIGLPIAIIAVAYIYEYASTVAIP